MPHASPWTAARVRALPDDGNRYEVVNGELLVTPSPRTPHQRAVGRLFLALGNYFERAGGAEVFLSPADVEFNPHTLAQPDFFVVPLREGKKLRSWDEISTLMLAIEVLSPSTARYDRITKRRLYQGLQIEYWIVDLDARVVERWRPGDERPEILTDRIEWLVGHGAEWTLDLEAYFSAVLDP